MNPKLPSTMRALELRAYTNAPEALAVAERPLPAPRTGQVLVRMAAAPVNPSDMMFVRGQYGVRKPLPTIPGWEGSGTVVAAGGGLWARALLGQRVACAATTKGDGTWTEYMVTAVQNCVPLRPGVSTLRGAMMLVNPLTAWALVDLARRGQHRAVVQTAAASALGGMIRRLAQHYRLPMIHIVRRDEQVAQLCAEGAEYVLNSNAPDFEQRLKGLCEHLGATLAFDAVAGEMPGHLLNAMPHGARVTIYGALSGDPCVVDPGRYIFKQQGVDGFWLSDWLAQQTVLRQFHAAMSVQRFLANTLKTEVRACFPLEDAAQGLKLYTQQMSAGKILLMPGLRRSHRL